MTIQQCACRDRRLIQRIRSVLERHEHLRPHLMELQVSINDAAVLLQGYLPSEELKASLEPAVRQAGVLDKIENQVHVSQ